MIPRCCASLRSATPMFLPVRLRREDQDRDEDAEDADGDADGDADVGADGDADGDAADDTGDDAAGDGDEADWPWISCFSSDTGIEAIGTPQSRAKRWQTTEEKKSC